MIWSFEFSLLLIITAIILTGLQIAICLVVAINRLEKQPSVAILSRITIAQGLEKYARIHQLAGLHVSMDKLVSHRGDTVIIPKSMINSISLETVRQTMNAVWHTRKEFMRLEKWQSGLYIFFFLELVAILASLINIFFGLFWLLFVLVCLLISSYIEIHRKRLAAESNYWAKDIFDLTAEETAILEKQQKKYTSYVYLYPAIFTYKAARFFMLQ